MRKCVLLLLALLLALPTAALADDTQFIEHAPFALDDTWVNGSTRPGEYHYYPFTVEQVGLVTVRAQLFCAGRVQLLDADLIEWDEGYFNGSAGAPETKDFVYYLEPGTYYVCVGNDSSQGDFRIKGILESCPSTETEDNDDYLGAQALPSGETLSGVLTQWDEHDYYTFTLDVEAQVYLTANTTLESLIESMTSQGWRDRLFAAVTADVQITEEDLRAYYDQAVANAEMAYTADPQSYESDRLGGAAVFWNPQGYRRVKRVLIPFSDENAARMQELTAQISGGDEAAISAAVAEMDAIYRSLDATVEEVQGRIAAGEDFEALIDAYGADPYLAEGGAGREDGYYVGVGSQLLDPDFVAAAMALDVPGDTSEPVECAEGVYILRYEGDVEPGAVSYEDFLADEALRAAVEENLRSTYYNETVEQWLDEAAIEFYPENF